MIKRIAITVCILLITAQAGAANKIMAVVNDTVITESEVEDYLNVIKLKASAQNPEFDDTDFNYTKSDALNDLIEDKLIVQAAREQQFQIPRDLIDKRLDEFIDQFKYREDFENSLIKQGLTVISLREKIRDQILMRQIINKEIEDKVEITPHEITAFYQAHKQDFVRPASVNYIGLQFAQKAKADEVFEQLKSARTPDDIIEEYRKNKVSGILFEGESRKELKTIFNAQLDKPMRPVTIDGRHYIFIVTEKNPPTELSLRNVKNQIYDYLYASKYDILFSKWLNKLQKNAVIKIFNET